MISDCIIALQTKSEVFAQCQSISTSEEACLLSQRADER